MMTRTILAAAAALLLAGCAELAARGATYSLEGVDAAKDFVDEKTDRREKLRRDLYDMEDRVMDCYTSQTMIAVDAAPDCSEHEQAYQHAKAFFDEIYPDLSGAVTEIQEFRNAVRTLK